MRSMNNAQPKPTTGEWTIEMVATLMNGLQGALLCRVIADAHNAALDVRQQHIDNLDVALSAEREKFDALASTQFDLDQKAMDWCAEAKQLRSELAAESQLNADIGAVIRDFAVELCGSEFGSTGDEAAYTPMKVRAFLSRLRSQLADKTQELKNTDESWRRICDSKDEQLSAAQAFTEEIRKAMDGTGEWPNVQTSDTTALDAAIDSAVDAAHQEILILRTQLAAREKEAQRWCEKYSDKKQQLRKQLDAEREKVQPLVDALELMFHVHVLRCDQCSGPDDGCEQGQRLEEIKLNALAKEKEGR